jgi:rubredoxin
MPAKLDKAAPSVGDVGPDTRTARSAKSLMNMSSNPGQPPEVDIYVNPDTRYCPACNADWQGEEIPPEHRKYYAEGTTHGSRLIGIYDRAIDRTVEWRCPDCGARFPRG